MKYLNLIGTLFVVFFCANNMLAQQDAQYTQYMYSTLTVNPAYAGSRGVLSAVAIHRSQWLGIEGAPATNTLSAHTPLGKRRKVGLGVTIVNDRVGPVTENYLSTDFSYTLDLKKNNKLSFGLKATAQMLNIDLQSLTLYSYTDPSFYSSTDNTISPNIGMGFYYHNDSSYLGASVPNLLETEHFQTTHDGGERTLSSVDRVSYYFIGGHVFPLNYQIDMKTAFLVKFVAGAPIQTDISTSFRFNDRFTLGVNYRLRSALSLLGGIQLNDNLMIGMTYDYEITELQQYSSGTFEALVRFELFNKLSNMMTPRFF